MAIEKLIKLSLALILAITFVAGCESEGSQSRLLAPASGTPGEIILVMDSLQWQGDLGDALRETLEVDVEGVAQPEPMFTVRYIEPTRFNSVLNKAANIIFVATLDSKTRGGQTVRNFMTKDYIKEHPDKFILSQKDIYASGQYALYLFSPTAEELAGRIRNNKEVIRQFFNEKELERLTKKLYRSGEQKKIGQYLAKKHGFSIRVPAGYRVAADDSAFFWLRKPGTFDKSIFITYRPYTSEEMFSDASLIAYRDSITRAKIFEDPADPATFTRVDTLNNETVFRTVRYRGHYARQVKGIWYSNTKTLGGAFTSLAVLDEASNRLYWIDGFVIAPNKDKKAALRELEAIINTFDPQPPAPARAEET